MSQSKMVRLVNAGSHLFVKKPNRTGSGRVLAKSLHGAQVTISVDASEEEQHFDAARYYSPIVISNANNKLNFKASSGGPQLTATVANGTYADPNALATAVRDALVAADPSPAHREWIVDWDPATHKFTLRHIDESTGLGDYFDILWQTGTNGSGGTDTHIGTALGFVDTSDDLSAGAAAVVGEALAYSTGGADVLPAAAHVPVLGAPAPVVKANGVALTLTTDYTIVLATGVVTLEGGQTTLGDLITIDYSYTSLVANASKTADNPVGTVPSWTAKPNIVVKARGEIFYDLPVGKILRFKADVGQVELTFIGSQILLDPQPQGRPYG